MEDSDTESDDTVSSMAPSYEIYTISNMYESIYTRALTLGAVLDNDIDKGFIALLLSKWEDASALEINTKYLGTINEYNDEFSCMICSEDSHYGYHCGCEHIYCTECWSGYIQEMSDNRCVNVRCPDPECTRYVPRSLWSSVGREETYDNLLVNDCVMNSSSLAFCPGIDCKYIVYKRSEDINSFHCKDCMMSFCFSCKNEIHEPILCSLRDKWEEKANSEGYNITWVKKYTKPCPNCRTPIEKNQGCIHMTCYSCKYEFCWHCLGVWNKDKKDGYTVHGIDTCKINNVNAFDDVDDNSYEWFVQNYTYYLEHLNSQRALTKTYHAIASIDRDMKTTEIALRLVSYHQTLLTVASDIVDKRGLIRWSYVYSYFYRTPSSEATLFEDIQKSCERLLEELNQTFERVYNIIQKDDVKNVHLIDELIPEVRSKHSIVCKRFDNLQRDIANDEYSV